MAVIYEKTEDGCIEITKDKYVEAGVDFMEKTLRQLREDMMLDLLMVGMEDEEILKISLFMKTQEMIQEMISAMEGKNFQMTEREVWNAAGTIVKKHL